MSRVRRLTGGVLAVFVLSLAPAGADEVYRWTDEDGTVHYSNVGAPEAARDVQAQNLPGRESSPAERREAGRTDEGMPQEEEEASPWADTSDQDFSTLVSQTRRDLQQEIGDKQERIAAIDADLAEIRSAQAQAMGKVGRLQGEPTAGPVESEEAEELREEREKLQQEISDLRKEYEELREEAVRRYGSVPGWWLPLR